MLMRAVVRMLAEIKEVRRMVVEKMAAVAMLVNVLVVMIVVMVVVMIGSDSAIGAIVILMMLLD